MTVRRVVVGVDGSSGGELAVAWCASLAAQLGAEVVAVRAYTPLDELGATPGADLGDLAAAAAARLRDEWCAALTAAGVSFRTRLVEDLPVEALVLAAVEERADLVVIGSHGETGWRERLLGRVASGLPERSPCPVVIVPHPAPAG